MAITKLISPNTPNPITAGPNGDWDLAMAQLTAVKKLLAGEQMMLTEWTNATTQPKLALGTHLQHKGSIYVVDTEDYALPALGGNGTYYIVLEPSGSSLVGSWVTSLGGYTWDATYNGLYNGDKLALPYQVVKSASGIAKRKILNPWSTGAFSCVNYLGVVYGPSIEVSGDVTVGGDVSATGKLTGATLNTGQGDFKIGQNLRTTDAPTFATINTGQGDFKIGQNLRTTDDVAFGQMIASTRMGLSSYTSGSVAAKSVSDDSSTTLPAQSVGEYRRVTFGQQVVDNSTDAFGDKTNHNLTFYAPAGGLYFIVMASGSSRGATLVQRVVVGGEAFYRLRSTDKETGVIAANSVFIVWRIA